MIEFACKGCGKVFKVSDSMAGKVGSCRHCGDRMTIPPPNSPILRAEPPAEVYRAEVVASPPRSTPPPASGVVNVGVSIHQPASGKETSGLGVASSILGILALLICWIPLLGLLAIPLILIGGVLGLIGVIVALTGKRVGIGWPMAGTLTNGAALLAIVVVTTTVAGTGALFVDAVRTAKKASDQAKSARVKAATIAPDKVDALAILGADGEQGAWLWIGTDKAGYPDLVRAIDRLKRGGLAPGESINRLAESGKARIIANGSKLRILEVDPDAVRVEILDGEDTGKGGWTAHGNVHLDR